MFMMNKRELRKHFLSVRECISQNDKSEYDDKIYDIFIKSDFINRFNKFLIYISVRNEPDTYRIIQFLLDNKKKIAVPFCNSHQMKFYLIESLDNLIEGKFGIPSVDVSSSEQISDFEDTLCIVPGVSFDNNCSRLGYGGGYYDRFLSVYNVVTLGVCYEVCISDNIPCEIFDIKMDYVLTENGFKSRKNKEVLHNG